MMSVSTDRTESRFLRGRQALAATLAALTLSFALAPTAFAARENTDARGRVNVGVDVLILRPMGFVGTAGGIGLFAIALPIVAITRPSDIGYTFDALVMRPIRYTWVDPIGDHAIR